MSEGFFDSVDPDEMQHYAAFHLGLHCLQKYSLGVSGIQRVNSACWVIFHDFLLLSAPFIIVGPDLSKSCPGYRMVNSVNSDQNAPEGAA